MNNDPYTSPLADPFGSTSGMSAGVSAAAVRQLEATKPWVRFFSVLIFIGAGFMLLAAAGLAIVGTVGAAAGSGKGAMAGMRGGMGIVIAVVYAALAFVYIFPGLKLWKYANAIAALLGSGSEADLVDALDQQRAFWRFMGIVAIVVLSIYVLVIAGVVVTSVVAAASMRHH